MPEFCGFAFLWHVVYQSLLDTTLPPFTAFTNCHPYLRHSFQKIWTSDQANDRVQQCNHVSRAPLHTTLSAAQLPQMPALLGHASTAAQPMANVAAQLNMPALLATTLECNHRPHLHSCSAQDAATAAKAPFCFARIRASKHASTASTARSCRRLRHPRAAWPPQPRRHLRRTHRQ